MFRIFLFLALLCSTYLSAQRSQHMRSNRYGYATLGAGVPYLMAKAGIDIGRHAYFDLQAFTDGGGIWRTNSHNDWRSISLLARIPIPSAHLELRAGTGIVQSQERLQSKPTGSLGMAPQIGMTIFLNSHLGLHTGMTWPISPATEMHAAGTLGLEYRWGHYKKENGLYHRRGRPLF